MPAFDVPAEELQQLVAFLQSRVLPLAKTAISGDAHSGEALFFGKGRCAECHMVWGRGSVNGPISPKPPANSRWPKSKPRYVNQVLAARIGGYHVAKVHLVKGRRCARVCPQ